MNEIKQLPKGIPGGYRPQKMRVTANATILVSEWARNAAHELNDKHHNWIEARIKDEFADENLSEAQIRDALDHTALLMSWDLIEEYVPKIERDYTMILDYVHYLNQNKGHVGRRKVSKQQWAAHRLAQMEEANYKICLAKMLRRRRGEFRYAANSAIYGITDEISSDLDAAGVIYAVLRGVLSRLDGPMLTDEERAAIGGFKAYLKQRRTADLKAGIIFPEESEPAQ